MSGLLSRTLKRFLNLPPRLWDYLIEYPLPKATEHELALAAELKREFKKLPEHTIGGSWNEFLNQLKDDVQTKDVRTFLRWPTIQHTMFMTFQPYLKAELDMLKESPRWNNVRKLLKESPIGHPTPYRYMPSSSGNLIHHTYTLHTLEETTGIKIDQLKFIFEFGGGYGSMCRLFHNMGFKGKYVIFDFPEFHLIQTFYLKCSGYPVRGNPQTSFSEPGIYFVSNPDLLPQFTSQGKGSLFWATWSLSETPLTLRHKIMEICNSFEFYLFGFQDNFDGMNNNEYFEKLLPQISKGKNSKIWKMDHLIGNSLATVWPNP